MRVESDALLCLKSRETVLKRVIGGCGILSGRWCEITCAGNHDWGADFRFDCSFKDANHHVTWFQSISSDSVASSRRREAARNSLRSLSDQESDQSIFR